MSGKTAILAIRVISDVRSAQKGAQETTTAWDKAQQRISKMTTVAVGIGAGLVQMGRKAVDSASQLQQSSGAVEAVFKQHAKGITDFSKTAWETVGMAQSEVQQMATTLGAQLKNMGTPMEDVAGKTTDLVKLGADLAATYGGTTSDAVSSLSALLRGERDPIEKYGVAINEAAVKAEALSMGIVGVVKDSAKVRAAQAKAEVAQRRWSKAVQEHGKDSDQALTAEAQLVSAQSRLEKAMKGSTAELTAQQKAQATLSLLSKQTADAQGAFAREADTFEGQQARAAARWENVSAKIGTAFLPVVTEAQERLSQLAGWVEKNQGLVVNLAKGIGIAAVAVIGLNGGIKTVQAVTTAFGGLARGGATAVRTTTNFVAGMRSAQAAQSAFTGTAGTLGGKVAALVSAMGRGAAAAARWAVQTTILTAKFIAQQAAQLAIAVASRVAAVAQALWNAVMNANPIMLIITLVIGAILLLIANWDKVKAVALVVWDAITIAAKWLWENVLVPIGEFIGGLFVGAWNALKTAAVTVWEAITAPARWLWNDVLVPLGKFLKVAMPAAWMILRARAVQVWNAITAPAKWLWDKVLVPFGKFLRDTFVGAWKTLQDVGKKALDAILTPVQNLVQWLKDAWEWVSKIFEKGGELIGKVFGFSAPVKVEGATAQAASGLAPFIFGSGGSSGPAVIQEIHFHFEKYLGDRHELEAWLLEALRRLKIKNDRIVTA